MSRFRAMAVFVSVALLVPVLAPQRVSALEEHARSGFFIGFGLGGGYATWDWAGESDDNPGEGSGVGQFRIGGALRDDLVIGLEATSWVKNYDVEFVGDDVGDAKVTFSASTFAATWFPGNLGWFLRGGVGFASAKGEISVDALDTATLRIEATDNGVAVLGATGYEWRFTKKFAMGPQVELFFLGIDGDLVKDVLVVDGAVEFTWYW